jgi:hypothetical protein
MLHHVGRSETGRKRDHVSKGAVAAGERGRATTLGRDAESIRTAGGSDEGAAGPESRGTTRRADTTETHSPPTPYRLFFVIFVSFVVNVPACETRGHCCWF